MAAILSRPQCVKWTERKLARSFSGPISSKLAWSGYWPFGLLTVRATDRSGYWPFGLLTHMSLFSAIIVFAISSRPSLKFHYCDVIMSPVASQITSLTIVYSIVYSGTDQRKHKSSASLAFMRGIHRRPVNSPHKWPVTRKMFPFDDVIMLYQTPANLHNVQSILRYLAWPMHVNWPRRNMHFLLFQSWWRHHMEILSALLALCAGNSPAIHKGQWCGVLMFSLICASTNDWVNNRDAGDLRRHHAHYNVTVMSAQTISDPELTINILLPNYHYQHHLEWHFQKSS